MILVDTSIWIDLFNSSTRKRQVPPLRSFVTCGPVVQDVLQGFRDDPRLTVARNAFLNIPVLSDPLPLQLFLNAADIFRTGRRRGLTIRSSIDCLIAAVAIENGVPVWHRDRDFDFIASFTSLRVMKPEDSSSRS
jgi:predicted nucleic acid-binding protein